MSKQRLIDANALALTVCNVGFKHFKASGCHPGDGAIPVAEAMNLCNAAPTIDAIPVSWLREKMDGYAAKLRSTELAALVTVMQMWEQEGI